MKNNSAIDNLINNDRIENGNNTNKVYDSAIVNTSLQLITKGTGILFIGTVIGTIFQAFFPIMIARYYTPADFGVYTLAVTVFFLLLPISNSGIGEGCCRHIAFYRGKGDYKKIKEVIISSIELILIIGILVAILLFLSAEWISINIFNTEALITPLKILAVALPFWLIIDIIVATFRGFDRTQESVYFWSILIYGGKLLFIIPVLILGLPFNYIFYAFTGNVLIVFLIAVIYFKRKIPKEIKTIRPNNSVKKDLLIFAIPLILSGMALLLLQGIDKFMIGYYMQDYDVGIYNVAFTISGYLHIFLVSFVFIYQPVGTKLYAQGKDLEIIQLYQTITKWIFLLASPIIMFVFIAPEITISVLFDVTYLGASLPLLILFVAYSIHIGLGPASGSIIMLGKTKQLMVIVGSMAVINLILNWYLVPIYGIFGAAIATGTSIIILSFLQVGFLYKVSKIHPFKKLYFKIISAFMFSFAIVYLLINYLPINFSAYGKILLIICSYIFFIVLLIIFRLFKEEDLLIITLIEKKLKIKIPFIRKIIR